MPLVAHAQCKKIIRGAHERSMICLGGAGSSSCKGDSGGPLVCEESGYWILRGASSFGTSDLCPADKYVVYARVSSYIDWIKDNIGTYIIHNWKCYLYELMS